MNTNNPAQVLLLATLVALSASADLPPNAADRIEGICLAVHGDVVMDGLAAFARNNGLTRDEMSAAMVEVIERRGKDDPTQIRDMATSWLHVFGGTNALPVLKRMALDPDDPDGNMAVHSYYAIAGVSSNTLGWAEMFLVDAKPETADRRRAVLGAFRSLADADGTTEFERRLLLESLLRATAVADNAPLWTDAVLCRRIPSYGRSADRRRRLEADSARANSEETRDAVGAALSELPSAGLSPMVFSPLPDTRSPPATRVLPDEFVLPEIPQEWRE